MTEILDFPLPPKRADPLLPPNGASDNDKLVFNIVREIAALAGRLNSSGYYVELLAQPAQTYQAVNDEKHLRIHVNLGPRNLPFDSTIIIVIETLAETFKTKDEHGPVITVYPPQRYALQDAFRMKYKIMDPGYIETWLDYHGRPFAPFIRTIVEAVQGLPNSADVSKFAGFSLQPVYKTPDDPDKGNLIRFPQPEGNECP